MSRQWVIVGAIVAALGLGVVALTRFGPEIEQVQVGAKAPDFRVVDLANGDSVSLRKRYAGSVTLVNIWATWCVPCRTEMPSMQEAYAAFKPRGFRIAAVSIDEGSPDAVRQFVRELGLTFDILLDQSTLMQQAYQTTGVPESFLLDRNGVIVKRVIGAHDWNSPANRKLIERYLVDRDSRISVARSGEREPGR